MAGLGTGAGPPVVNVYHEKSRILPDVSRVLACLYEKNVKFETIKASYKDLLSLQASRSVPVPFYDGPVFLQDSRAICRYIAETYEHQGYPFLLGKDVLERASIEQWLRHEEHAFDPPSRALFCHIAFPPQHEDDDDHEGINRETRKLEEVLEVYEQRLGETEFLAGNKFTLADLVHLPGTHHVITSERFAYLYDSRKNVQRWWHEISARESWQNVLRDMKIVEEEHELEKQRELEEQQKQQWLTEPSPTIGGRDIRIDPRKHEGTKSQTVLVPPPSTGTIVSASIIPPAPQDRGTTSDQKPSSPNQIKEGGFFTAPEKPPPPSREIDSTTRKSPSGNSTESTFFTPAPIPTTAKIQHQKTDTEKFTNKDSSEPDSCETKSKRTGVSPQVDKPVPLTNTTPDTQTPQIPYVKPPEQRGTDTSIGSEPGQKLKTDVHTAGTPSNGDTHVIDDVDRFSTKRLRAVFNPDIEDSQHPAKQEEAPVVPKNREIHDREKKTTMIPDSGESGSSPSTGVRPPYAPITEQERSDRLPPKEGMVTKGPEKSPSIQQSPPSAPSSDKLAKTAGAAPRTPTEARSGSALVHKADPSNIVTSDEQTDKSSKMGQRKLEATPSETPAADSRGTSAPVQEETRDAHEKQAPAGLGDILDVQDTGDGDVTEKDVDKRAAEPTLSPQKTTEPIKRVSPTLQGITGDDSTKAAPHAPEQAPASSRQNASIVPPGGTLDTNGKEAAKPSPVDPRGTPPTTQGRLAPTPDTQHPTASGKMSARSPDLPLSDTRNEKTGITEPTLSPQQTTEPIKGVSPNLQGITDNDSTKAAPPAPVQALASSKQNASIVPPRGTLDTNGKEAAKTSPVDPSGTTPTTPGRLAPTLDTQRPTASGKMSAQSPELPLPDTRNEKTGIAQTSQTSTAEPNEQLRNTSIKLHEYVGEAYKERVSAQQQPGILSGAKLAENRTREGDDVAQNAETGKPKEEDHNPNANENNNRKAQATTNDGPSKLQIQSGVNESKTSNDSGAGTNETANSRSLETSREVLPSTPANSVEQKQLQGNRFGTSVQNNVNHSSEAGSLGSGTEQQKKNNVPKKDDKNNGKTPGGIMHEEKISSDTQQVTDKIRNSKSDSSSSPEGSDSNG
ncbi:hypothetical protein EJB05_08707 [Eragrostis curvula]|uniref:glutathione transferase n=1 Tax=Eragrostis curvula TaxID=38414 RepID=A0A5J9W4S4_9POAL|nr:hypothetical protein EJB05_08707 [Eragrostis curvula]